MARFTINDNGNTISIFGLAFRQNTVLEEEIQAVYAFMLGRPADPAGLAFFMDSPEGLYETIAQSEEFFNLYSPLTSTSGEVNTATVVQVYNNAFGRDSDRIGEAHWLGFAGRHDQNIAEFAAMLAVLSIELSSFEGTPDGNALANKTKAAQAFTNSLDTEEKIAAYSTPEGQANAKKLLESVTSDPATIPDAETIAQIASNLGTEGFANQLVGDGEATSPGSSGGGGGGGSSPPPSGKTITTDIDQTVSPSAANTALQTTAQDDTITFNTVTATPSSFGSVDGGGGNDTLRISTQGDNGGDSPDVSTLGANAAAASLSTSPSYADIETLILTASGGDGGNGSDATGASNGAAGGTGGDGSITFDLSAATDLQKVVNEGSTDGANGSAGANDGGGNTGGAGGTGGSGNVTVSNISTGVTAAVEGTVTGDTVFDYTGVLGGSDMIDLELVSANIASGAFVRVDGVEQIDLDVDGASTLDELDADTLTTINITGNNTLSLGLATDTVNVSTVDASALTGGLTIDLNGATGGVSVTGTGQADTITFDANTANVDTVIYTASTVSTASQRDTITNFEMGDQIDLQALSLVRDASTSNEIMSEMSDGDSFASFNGSNLGIAEFETGSDLVVYVDLNENGTFEASSDMAILLTGTSASGFDPFSSFAT